MRAPKSPAPGAADRSAGPSAFCCFSILLPLTSRSSTSSSLSLSETLASTASTSPTLKTSAGRLHAPDRPCLPPSGCARPGEILELDQALVAVGEADLGLALVDDEHHRRLPVIEPWHGAELDQARLPIVEAVGVVERAAIALRAIKGDQMLVQDRGRRSPADADRPSPSR